MNITILGAGAFGTALASILEENHHNITYFDPIKYPNISLEQSLTTAEIILVATPSSSIDALAPQLKTRPEPIILATKGLLSLDDFAPHPISIISGPAFADDLLAKKPVALTATTPLTRTLFDTPWLNTELTPDTLGVLFCGSLKNVYALGSGLLAKPDNYVEKALAELKVYLKQHKASPTTADLSCGLPDLALTCTDPRSRNFQYGLAFSRNPQSIPSQTTEGIETLARLSDYRRYSILRAIHEVFSGNARSMENLSELMSS